MTKSEKTRADLTTEKQNPGSINLDAMSVRAMLTFINSEDQTVAEKVADAISDIEKTVELTTDALRNGNRIYYIGAGTSGRLGVLDASEMPPTFSVPSDWFKGLIAGGDNALRNSNEALRKSIEGAEDKPENAEKDLNNAGLSSGDVLIGISTSGAATYVKAAIEYAKMQQASTVYLICNPEPYLKADADIVIRVDVGPEVITGSTRMKSGTATKLVLNMISTATMVALGKVYRNLMVDLMAVNEKLVDRGTRIIVQLTGLQYTDALEALKNADMSVKKAVVMVKDNCSGKDADALLKKKGGILRDILD